MKKPVCDIVKGCSFGADKRGHMMVMKVDLGHLTKAFIFDSSVARFLFEQAPVLERDHSAMTAPVIVHEDWNGAITPVITDLKVTEFDNCVVLFPKLQKGETDGLLFTPEGWSYFMKHLWQYHGVLRHAQDATGPAN